MHSLTLPFTMLAPLRWLRFMRSWVPSLGTTCVSPEIRMGSLWQSGERPSPAFVLPSSHCSPSSTVPLPHTEEAAAGGAVAGGAVAGGAVAGGAVAGGAASGGPAASGVAVGGAATGGIT